MEQIIINIDNISWHNKNIIVFYTTGELSEQLDKLRTVLTLINTTINRSRHEEYFLYLNKNRWEIRTSELRDKNFEILEKNKEYIFLKRF